MAKETFYPEQGQGGANVSTDDVALHEAATTFANLRAGAGTFATTNATSANFGYLRATTNNDEYNRMDRAIFTIDVSGFTGNPDNITDISFSVYPYSISNGLGGNHKLSLVLSAPADPASIAAGDYDSLGTTKQASDLAISSMSMNAYNVFTLNAAGIQSVKDAINGSGIIKFGTRLTCDNDNSPPTWVSEETIGVYGAFADVDVEARRPKLEITYSAGGNAIIHGVNL